LRRKQYKEQKFNFVGIISSTSKATSAVAVKLMDALYNAAEHASHCHRSIDSNENKKFTCLIMSIICGM